MEQINLFWPIYKNLEKEVLDMTYYIHFCDNQINVYSTKIAELLIRCVVEVEAIAKALYEDVGGEMNQIDESGNQRYVKFDFDCLKLLDKKWKLGRKQITIVAPSIYFQKAENKTITPLKNAHKGDTVWQKAYQAVKHSRTDNLSQANIKSLIRAMAALYLLNIYNSNPIINAGTGYLNTISNGNENTIIDNLAFSEGSELFSAYAFSHPMPCYPTKETYVQIDNVYVYCKCMTSLSYIMTMKDLQEKEEELKKKFPSEDFNNPGSEANKMLETYIFQAYIGCSYQFVVNKGQVIYH